MRLKPIIESGSAAVKELVSISKSGPQGIISEATLQSLAKRFGVYTTSLPGSLSDMKRFRNDILSMMKKHGSPSFFLTLSSAECMWPETFVEISNGAISVEKVRFMFSSERAELVGDNPVRTAIPWKKRVIAQEHDSPREV